MQQRQTSSISSGISRAGLLFVCLSAFAEFNLTNASAAPKPVVGLSLPLSGVVARMGESLQRGFKLYQKQHPHLLSRVKVVFDDHRYESRQVLGSFHHLTKIEKADFIAVWGNTPSETLAPLAERDKVPALFMTHEPVARDRKYAVAMGNKFDKAIALLADFFKSSEAKHPAALYANLGNALRAVASLKQALHGNLLEIAVEPDVTSFQPLILRMRRAGVDNLLLFTVAEQAIAFGQQAKALRFSPMIIGGDVFADEVFLARAEEFFGSIKFVYGKVNRSFIESYRREFGDLSYFFEAASGYTIAALIYEGIGRTAAPPPATWADVLHGADFANLPLVGLQLTSSPDDGLRLECESAIYSSETLLR